MRKLHRVLTLTLVAVMMALSLMPNFAAADTPTARQKTISEGVAEVWSRTHNEQAVQGYLRRQALEIVAAPEIDPVTKLAKKPEVSADSSPGNMYIPGPTVAYDRLANQYFIYFNWSWNHNCTPGGNPGGTAPCWYPDTPAFPGSVGGLDGWGINIGDSSVLTLAYQQLVTYYENGTSGWISSNAVPQSGNNGAVVEQQDNYSWGGTTGVASKQ